MRIEKQNIIREKLNELGEIPEGFRFEQEMTWNRLEMRLTSSSPNRRPVWLTLPVLLLTRFIRVMAKLVAGEGIQSPNRRRNRKRLNSKRPHRHI